MFGGETGAAHVAGLGHARDQRAAGVPQGPPGVPGAALTRPDDDHRETTTETGAIPATFPLMRLFTGCRAVHRLPSA